MAVKSPVYIFYILILYITGISGTMIGAYIYRLVSKHAKLFLPVTMVILMTLCSFSCFLGGLNISLFVSTGHPFDIQSDWYVTLLIFQFYGIAFSSLCDYIMAF